MSTWHVTTVAFLAVGVALILTSSGPRGRGSARVGAAAAATCTGFAAVIVELGAADTRSAGSLFRHPGPLVLTATAALAWWGAA